jgi:hypothetical protein
MANWFYYDYFGVKQGPVTQKEFANLIRQGTITPKTRVETEISKTEINPATGRTMTPKNQVKTERGQSSGFC